MQNTNTGNVGVNIIKEYFKTHPKDNRISIIYFKNDRLFSTSSDNNIIYINVTNNKYSKVY